MVILNVKGKTFYMDNKLEYELEKKIKPSLLQKDEDWTCIVDGEEGAGKSVFSFQLAKKVDADFNLSRVCTTPMEFTKAILRADKGQCVVFDEAFTGLSSRGSLTEVNNLIVSLMMEMRQKNLFVIIVMPTIFLLDKYAALWRAKGLFHVYKKRRKKGFWIFFNKNKKKILYLTGRKLYSYTTPRSNFRGRFYDQYTIDEKRYREKKRESLMRKARVTRAETYKGQRDTLFWILNKILKKNQTEIAKMCKEAGFKIEQNTISEILIIKQRQILEEELIKEESLKKKEEIRRKIEEDAKKTPKISQKPPIIGEKPVN